MGRGRELGGMERLFFQQNSVGSCNMCSILFYEGDFDVDALPQALARVQTAFPLLTARIKADPYLRFEEAHDLIPFQVIERQSDNQWRLTVRNEVKRQYQDARIHITVVKGKGRGEIIVSIDHTLADAKSLYVVCQYLIAGMHQRELSYVPVGDAWESRVTREYRGVRGLVRKFQLVRKLFRVAPPRSIAFGVDATTRTVESFGVQFEKTTLARIKAASEANQTNLNALFCAAAMLTAFELFAQESSGVVCLNTPVSTREMIVPAASPLEMGMFLSTLLQWHGIDRTTNIWDLSRKILSTLRSDVKSGDPIALGLLAKGPRRPKVPKFDKNKARLAQSLTVSNPGRLESFEDLPDARIVGYRNLGSLWPQESITVVVLGYSDFLCVDAEISVERLGHVPNAASRLAQGIESRVLALLK